MNAFIKYCAVLALAGVTLTWQAGAQGQPVSGSRVRDLIIEDSLTPTKMSLRGFVADLRDSLVKVEALQARLVRSRAANMTSVVVSQGRELARNCTNGAAMVTLTTKRIEPMNTQNEQGDLALHAYRSALATLGEDLRRCAHGDSLTMAVAPLDQTKLESIATAARESISQYDVVRDGLMKLLGITLPIKGDIRTH